jgi:hypothetical protein
MFARGERGARTLEIGRLWRCGMLCCAVLRLRLRTEEEEGGEIRALGKLCTLWGWGIAH